MEEFDRYEFIWYDEPTENHCQFCGTVIGGQHLETCATNIISFHEGATRLWTRLFDDNKVPEDYYSDIGQQLMMSADQVLKAQKAWTDKSILGKMDEVFNKWGIITEFAEILYQLGIVQTATEVIDYYKNPTMYENEFTLWAEYDYPDNLSDTWQDFISRLDLSNNGEPKR
jgi:hypothetical protein